MVFMEHLFIVTCAIQYTLFLAIITSYKYHRKGSQYYMENYLAEETQSDLGVSYAGHGGLVGGHGGHDLHDDRVHRAHVVICKPVPLISRQGRQKSRVR